MQTFMPKTHFGLTPQRSYYPIMKLSPPLQSLVETMRIPMHPSVKPASRLSNLRCSNGLSCHQILPFSTSLRPQARSSKAPRQDPRIRSLSLNPAALPCLLTTYHRNDSLFAHAPPNAPPPTLLSPSRSSPLDDPSRRSAYLA